MIPINSGCLKALVLGLIVAGSVGMEGADGTAALSPERTLHDRRLSPLKDLDGYFPFEPSATREEWDRRAGVVRRQMTVALGLWPEPEKTPLNPVLHGRIDREGYSVEKVFFESAPGFFVTGSLYRPAKGPAPHPAILCPHGHWDDGRFMDLGRNRVRQEIAAGAERFEEGGRSVLQARSVQLARMGCIVFLYDMIGYADSQQIPMEIAHRFAKQRPEMNTTNAWGLFSPQAEAHLQSVMGLQTLNSIRALDFLLELPDVDRSRIGITGASGGGTQTFILGALDSRVALAFPAVMVSTAMQGGCTCENASLLRVETGNVEFAALFAPKPLGLTAANDWTREMAIKGFPELKKHYAMLGAANQVMLKPLVHFDHNYNYVSRAAMYSWVNKHFNLGLPEPVIEEDYKRLTKDELSVWDDAHPRPPGGPDFERQLLGWLTADADRKVRRTTESPETFRRLVGGAMDALIGRRLSDVGNVEFEQTKRIDAGNYSALIGLLRNASRGEEIPVVFLKPNEAKRHTVIWTHQEGKAGLFDRGSELAVKPEIKKLLDAGVAVAGVDLLYQGEFLKDGKPLVRTPRVTNPREAAAYTFGYNRAVFAQRVHDILTVAAFIRSQNEKPDRIDLVGLDGTGPLAAAARAQAGDAIDHTAVATGGFRFGQVLDLHDFNFLPGGAKYGDLPAILALAAPGKLWVAGEGSELPAVTRKIYGMADAPDHLVAGAVAQGAIAEAVVDWLR